MLFLHLALDGDFLSLLACPATSFRRSSCTRDTKAREGSTWRAQEAEYSNDCRPRVSRPGGIVQALSESWAQRPSAMSWQHQGDQGLQVAALLAQQVAIVNNLLRPAVTVSHVSGVAAVPKMPRCLRPAPQVARSWHAIVAACQRWFCPWQHTN